MSVLVLAVIGLTGYFTPATGDENLVPVKAQIDKLIVAAGQPKATPNYDKEVLGPLRAAQEAKRVADEALAKEQLERDRVVQVAQVQAIATLPPGSHTDWMTAAGIDPSNFGYVDYIVDRESGWNPCSFNPGQSNCGLTAEQIGNHACGLGQQLPCGKWAGAWNDPIAALRAMDGYVGRYGGWAGAYRYWLGHGNY